MVDAIKSQGFKFEIEDIGNPGTYIEVIGITSFTGLDGQAAEMDASHLGSTAKEMLLGLPDNGTFGLETNLLHSDAGQTALRTAKKDGNIRNFRATYSDATTDTFDGYVLSAPKSGAVDAKMDGSFSIRISGDVVSA